MFGARMRILFVANAFSVHTARWISQLRGTGWDVHVFDPQSMLMHEALEGVVLHTGWKKPSVPAGTRVLYHWPFLRGRHFLERRVPWLWKRILPPPQVRLARLLRRCRFDCIHALGLQRHAEVVQRTREHLGGTLPTPWIYSCMGSDIFYYRRFPEEETRIRRVLTACDYLMSDCARDVRLAAEHGFSGESLGVFPGGGGYPTETMRASMAPGGVSGRRVIAVKGLETDFGCALVSIEALKLCAEALRGFTIKVYQAHDVVAEAARGWADQTGVPLEVVPRSPYRKIWNLFGQSRLAIAVSRSDGIPNAMLEAMVMGAYPIQTNPGGVSEEWIDDGVNGTLVPHDDPRAISAAIRQALADDTGVDTAAAINRQLTRQRIDDSVVRPRVIEAYRRAAG